MMSLLECLSQNEVFDFKARWEPPLKSAKMRTTSILSGFPACRIGVKEGSDLSLILYRNPLKVGADLVYRIGLKGAE